MNKKLRKKLKNLPRKPGVYLFFAKGESASGEKDTAGQILYVGKALNLRNRVRSHFAKTNDIYKNDLIKNITDIDFIITVDDKEALILENELIKKYKPKYNIQWRDDKSYFWVSFSNDEWPRILITHNLKIENCLPDGRHGELKISPVGPFVNGTELKQVLRALRKILPYRTCKNSHDKPCLQWHLGLCPAHLRQGYSGQAHYRRLLITYHLSLNTLRQLLRLYAGENLRTEAYDISNIQGAHAVGSMIMFEGAKPKKSGYRRFRIKTVPDANDVKMLKEVLRRRLNHQEWPLPDLMLIDGGKAQLNSIALEISHWKLEIPFISLAKRDEGLYTIYSNKVLRLSSLPMSLRLIFQAIRNEAHRFAIAYYRKLHGKKFKFRTAPKGLRKKVSTPP